MGKKKKGGEDSSLGLLLIGFSLVMDAVTGGLQDKVKKRTKELNPDKGEKPVPTMHESMMWTNLSGFLVTLVLAGATGQMTEGVAFCRRNPEVVKAILIYSLASAVGQNFIYYTITQFNALVLTTVTTVRKIFTTVYSVFRNPANSLSNGQWGGCALVFLGKRAASARSDSPAQAFRRCCRRRCCHRRCCHRRCCRRRCSCPYAHAAPVFTSCLLVASADSALAPTRPRSNPQASFWTSWPQPWSRRRIRQSRR